MIFGKKGKWLGLILLYLITFAWDDDINPPERIRGYRLYIAGITCTEPIVEETIDILDVMARQYTVTGCGSRAGWYRAWMTSLGVIEPEESEMSNTVDFQFE